MIIKSGVCTACLLLIVASLDANAAIISVDLQTPGDNLVTRDTDAGLEWLDVPLTVNLSFDYVSSQFGSGGQFEGWRYASNSEVITLLDHAGGDGNYVAGSFGNGALVGFLAPKLGYTQTVNSASVVTAITGDYTSTPSFLRSYVQLGYSTSQTYAILDNTDLADNQARNYSGSALVRAVSFVPVPSAVWLFGSGLIGLIGIARRNS